MGKIYLNNHDKEILVLIKNKLDNQEERECLEKILEHENKNRMRDNKIASIYKKENRKQNKLFARSQNEIANKKILNGNL